MSDITVRALDLDEWEVYRSVRLEALSESPDAFVAEHSQEAEEGEEFWRARMGRSVRLVAEVADESAPVGVASIGEGTDGDDAAAGQLFGLWVTPDWRGRGVAAALVNQGATIAHGRGASHLYYWVGTDNARGVAFASSFGFRPTDDRRPMRTKTGDGEEEIALVLALGADRR